MHMKHIRMWIGCGDYSVNWTACCMCTALQVYMNTNKMAAEIVSVSTIYAHEKEHGTLNHTSQYAYTDVGARSQFQWYRQVSTE